MADAYEAITAADVSTEGPIRVTFGNKCKGNFGNHEVRLGAVEQGVILSDHFNWDFQLSGGVQFPNAALTSASPYGRFRDWLTFAALPSGGFYFEMLSQRISYSEWGIGIGSGTFAKIMSMFRLKPSKSVLPIRLDFLGRWDDLRITQTSPASVGDVSPTIGLLDSEGVTVSPTTFPKAGIYLNRAGADLLRFSMYDGTTTTNGTNTFARPTNNSDFSLSIEIADTPALSVICTFNGAVRETFLANLPMNRSLGAYFGCSTTTNGLRISCDKIQMSAAGILNGA